MDSAMAISVMSGGPESPSLCVSKASSVLIAWQNHIASARMVALISFLLNVVASLFKSKIRLEAENAALRHQLIVLQRKVRGRVPFTNSDRLFFVQLYRWFPSVLKAVTIIRPETLVRWHRAGFRRYWRRKSRSLGGRPQIEADLRTLIRRHEARREGRACASVWVDQSGRPELYSRSI
jgi:hypothetical protein